MDKYFLRLQVKYTLSDDYQFSVDINSLLVYYCFTFCRLGVFMGPGSVLLSVTVLCVLRVCIYTCDEII